ncbi:MAG: cytochrome c-type biogenesis CcmF C-terminal domain-containing protein, partial [bacterium]
PLLPWRRARPAEFSRVVAAPAALGILLAAVLAGGGLRSPGLLLMFALCGFVAATVGVEFAAGVRVRRARGESPGAALVALVAGNRRRYGGYVVHLGILLILVGVTASTAFATQMQVTLAPGEQASVGRYVLRYDRLGQSAQPGLQTTTATLSVAASGRPAGTIQPRHVYHVVGDQATAAIGLRSGWRDDLYVVLVGWSTDRRATFRILVNPLVMWLWTGGAVIALGASIAIFPTRRRETAASQVLVPREAGAPAGGLP